MGKVSPAGDRLVLEPIACTVNGTISLFFYFDRLVYIIHKSIDSFASLLHGAGGAEPEVAACLANLISLWLILRSSL